jgi:hypothetical protein
MLTHMPAKRGPKGPLTDTHKAAMAQGRNEGRTVRAYLEALRANKPKRGRKRTSETIKKRLAVIDESLATADPLAEVKYVQERRDLTAELESMGDAVDIDAIEEAFVAVAKSYSERQGIGYAAWREVGVPAAVLSRAGISRSS